MIRTGASSSCPSERANDDGASRLTINSPIGPPVGLLSFSAGLGPFCLSRCPTRPRRSSHPRTSAFRSRVEFICHRFPAGSTGPWHTGLVFDQDVRAVLEESQRLGFLGERDISEVIDHARAFVGALDGVTGTVADLGSGGGVPGFVIAHDRPDLHLVLMDRRAKRTDFLDRMVRRLRWSDRVTVICADVEHLIGTEPTIDAAVARGFGPPAVTLEMGVRLIRPGGRVIISEPPEGERWPKELLAGLGVRRLDDGQGTVSVFEHQESDGFT